MTPLFIAAAVAVAAGAVFSWRGSLNRGRFVAWGLAVTLGGPVGLTMALMVAGRFVAPNPPAEGSPLFGVIAFVWGNGVFGAMAVVLMALLDKVSSDH